MVLAKEINVVKCRTVIECVTRLATCSAGSTRVELFAGSDRIDAAVSQSFEVIEARRDGDIAGVAVVEGD